MTQKGFSLERTGADRGVALAGYGLLFVSIFSLGVTGLAALILAYAVRGQVSPGVRRHISAQIVIFWVALVFFLICIGTAIAATVIEVDDVVHANGDYLKHLEWFGGSIDVSGLRLVRDVLGLVVTSVVAGLLGALWTLTASAIGFIRLATAGPLEVTATA